MLEKHKPIVITEKNRRAHLDDGFEVARLSFKLKVD